MKRKGTTDPSQLGLFEAGGAAAATPPDAAPATPPDAAPATPPGAASPTQPATTAPTPPAALSPAASGAPAPAPSNATSPTPHHDSATRPNDRDIAALADALRARVSSWALAHGAAHDPACTAADAAARLVHAQHDGHVCIRIEDARERESLMASHVVALADAGGDRPERLPLVIDAAGRLYLHRVFDDERAFATRIVAASRVEMAPVAPDVQARLRLPHAAVPPTRRTNNAGVPTLDRQQLATALSLVSPVLVVSGAPGTGKTTTLARILDLALRQDPRTRIALAAPTGKAAARMTAALSAARAAGRVAAVPHAAGIDETAARAAGIDQTAARAAGIDSTTVRTAARDATAASTAAVTATSHLPPTLRARTVHAWLGVHPRTGRARHDARNPLEADLLVVDEASMLDLELARALMDALPHHARIVLLGDKDQLAAVQSGAVFAELAAARTSAASIASVAALTGHDPDAVAQELKIDAAAASQQDAAPIAAIQLVRGYRFGADSGIARLAAHLRDGDADAAIALLRSGNHGDDIEWRAFAIDNQGPITANTPQRSARGEAISSAPLDPIADHLDDRMQPYLDTLQALCALPTEADDEAAIQRCLHALDAWRLLCAVHDGPSGTRAWNRRAAARVRALTQHEPAQSMLATIDGPWFTGRAVMITRNDDTLGLVNGDVGLVLPQAAHRATAATSTATPTITPTITATITTHGSTNPTLRYAAFLRADGSVARWPVARLPAVETAFATSVHKAQGSEFDRVTLVLPSPWQRPCTRELVYTAITRARRHVTLIADEASLRASIGARIERDGGLRSRLAEALRQRGA